MQYNYLTGQSRNNHKTMRISDKSLEFILTFEGTTFNDQVNNMIDFFMNSKAVLESELQAIDEKIEFKKKLLNNLQSKSCELNDFINELQSNLRKLKYWWTHKIADLDWCNNRS